MSKNSTIIMKKKRDKKKKKKEKIKPKDDKNLKVSIKSEENKKHMGRNKMCFLSTI